MTFIDTYIYIVCTGHDYIAITQDTDGNKNFKRRRKVLKIGTINTYGSIQQCFVLGAYLEKI